MSRSERSTTLIAVIVLLVITNVSTVYYFLVLRDATPSEDVPVDIGDITGGNKEDYIGRVMTIAGYFIVAAGYPLLVSDLIYFENNSLSPENYILVTGSVPQSLINQAGVKANIKGTVNWADAIEGILEIEYSEHTAEEVEGVEPGYYRDQAISPDVLIGMPPLFDLDDTKYAVLFAGGIRPGRDFTRFWNNLVWMYFILTMHGYDPDNIYVIYRDGVGNDAYCPVHYPATHASLDTVFGELATVMGSRDKLFLYTTNHGGTGGLSLWRPLDDSYLSHAELKTYLDSLTYERMIIVMGQCYSGKFIQHLSAPNRVIITACEEDGTTLMCDKEGNWDEFAFHFMSALLQWNINSDGANVLSDMSGDGFVSMAEAFNWASARDSRPEHPMFDDDGDGVGTTLWQPFNVGDTFGSSTFL